VLSPETGQNIFNSLSGGHSAISYEMFLGKEQFGDVCAVRDEGTYFFFSNLLINVYFKS